jgi:DNA primase
MELAEECSLVGKKDEHYYDRFRKRVMFPIKDPNGRVIAFGGRVINDELPKYINSQETPIFKKRNVLYGMDKARRHFADMGRAIIVEGYLDVIGCHQAGIQNVVAPLGTALTEQQVRAIARYCEEIVMLFDADSAGINAALKSLDVVKDINVSIKIATLTDGDPFDCVIKRGAREFMAVVDKAQSPVDFRIERVMTLKRKNGPVKTLLLLFEVLRDIDLESNRSIYLKKISTMVGIDENAVRRDFVRFLEKGSAPQSVHDENDPQGQTDFITRGYRSLVALCCNHPALIGKAVMDFSISQIEDSASRNILGKMTDLYNENDSFQMNKLFDFFTNGIELDILNRSLNGDCRVEDPDAAYEEIYLNMKLHEIDCRIDKYADLIRKTPESRHEYLTEIEILRREKEKLSQYIYNRGRRV